jgi:hypothetical protein
MAEVSIDNKLLRENIADLEDGCPFGILEGRNPEPHRFGFQQAAESRGARDNGVEPRAIELLRGSAATVAPAETKEQGPKARPREELVGGNAPFARPQSRRLWGKQMSHVAVRPISARRKRWLKPSRILLILD